MASFGDMKKLACVVVLMVLIAAPNAAEASVTSCGQVISTVSPCLGYLRGGGGPVPVACCNGIRALNSAAQTTPDRQTACKCLKSAAASMGGLNLGLAAGVPGKCGVNIPYKISPTTDCNSVK